MPTQNDELGKGRDLCNPNNNLDMLRDIFRNS